MSIGFEITCAGLKSLNEALALLGNKLTFDDLDFCVAGEGEELPVCSIVIGYYDPDAPFGTGSTIASGLTFDNACRNFKEKVESRIEADKPKGVRCAGCKRDLGGRFPTTFSNLCGDCLHGRPVKTGAP